MKKLLFIFIVALGISFSLVSCSSGPSEAELAKQKADSIAMVDSIAKALLEAVKISEVTTVDSTATAGATFACPMCNDGKVYTEATAKCEKCGMEVKEVVKQ